MDNKKKTWGIILSIVGILAGLYLFYLLATTIMHVAEVKAATNRTDEALAVKITFSMLSWLGLAASALWAAMIYGFAKGKSWAGYYSILAASVLLLASYFPMIPPMSVNLPAPSMQVFFVALIVWFGFVILEKYSWKVIALVFVAGLAFVLIYMDGVAMISRYQLPHEQAAKGFYATAFGASWGASAAWLVFIMGALKRKSWTVPLGIFAATLSMFAGYTVSYWEHGFSMFLPAPVLSTVYLILLMFPGVRKLISDEED